MNKNYNVILKSFILTILFVFLFVLPVFADTASLNPDQNELGVNGKQKIEVVYTDENANIYFTVGKTGYYQISEDNKPNSSGSVRWVFNEKGALSSVTKGEKDYYYLESGKSYRLGLSAGFNQSNYAIYIMYRYDRTENRTIYTFDSINDATSSFVAYTDSEKNLYFQVMKNGLYKVTENNSKREIRDRNGNKVKENNGYYSLESGQAYQMRCNASNYGTILSYTYKEEKIVTLRPGSDSIVNRDNNLQQVTEKAVVDMNGNVKFTANKTGVYRLFLKEVNQGIEDGWPVLAYYNGTNLHPIDNNQFAVELVAGTEYYFNRSDVGGKTGDELNVMYIAVVDTVVTLNPTSDLIVNKEEGRYSKTAQTSSTGYILFNVSQKGYYSVANQNTVMLRSGASNTVTKIERILFFRTWHRLLLCSRWKLGCGTKIFF